MISISRQRSEDRFAAIERYKQKALSEKREETQRIAEKTARLKALRLAREAEERAAPAPKKAARRK
jgi:hypothetical protein